MGFQLNQYRHARTLGGRDGNDESLAEGNKHNDNNYSKDGNIPNDDDKYNICFDGLGEPLDRATTSAARTRACPASQRPSVPSR